MPELTVAAEGEGIDYATLIRPHPERQEWFEAWQDYRLLYKGGLEFKRAAGEIRAPTYTDVATSPIVGAIASALGKRWRRFLYQLDGEPDRKYESRRERLVYLNYYGPIIDFFSMWLFAHPPMIRPEEGDAPDWWQPFARNCDGKGTSFLDFTRDAFRESLIVRRSGWLIGTPDFGTATLTQQAAEESGLAGVRLTPYPADEIIDWEVDAAGTLEWVVLMKRRLYREFPNPRVEIETITYLDRQAWQVWEARKDRNGERILEPLGDGVHGLGDVPFVWIEIPHGLWVGNKLAQWAVDLFNKFSMLSYGQLMSCFLQPAMTTNEDAGTAQARILGEGIVLHLRAGRGDEPGEKFEWIAPSSAPLEFSAQQIAQQRDEGYRIVHQMANAVDAQSASGQARSGESKVQDRLPTEIILQGYGAYVRDAMAKTLNLVSRILD